MPIRSDRIITKIKLCGIKALVEKKISLPAYDQCLKASHVFNILDARGAISVAQRAGYIARIRDITKSAAGVWLDSQK